MGVELDPIEDAVLVTLRRSASAGGEYVKSRYVLEAIQESFGFAPDDAYRRITALSAPWLTALRLVDFHGNGGSRAWEPAEPRYTEVRLTPLGDRVADGIVGSAPALPIGLILGDIYKGGTRPPLHRSRLVDTIRLLAHNAEHDIGESLGAPSFPTGCAVEGDFGALWAGHSVQLTLTARIASLGSHEIRISHIPPRFSEDTVAQHLVARAGDLGIKDIHDFSTSSDSDIRVTLRSPVDKAVTARITETWGVHDLMICAYGYPLRDTIFRWIEADTSRLDALKALAE